MEIKNLTPQELVNHARHAIKSCTNNTLLLHLDPQKPPHLFLQFRGLSFPLLDGIISFQTDSNRSYSSFSEKEGLSWKKQLFVFLGDKDLPSYFILFDPDGKMVASSLNEKYQLDFVLLFDVRGRLHSDIENHEQNNQGTPLIVKGNFFACDAFNGNHVELMREKTAFLIAREQLLHLRQLQTTHEENGCKGEKKDEF